MSFKKNLIKLISVWISIASINIGSISEELDRIVEVNGKFGINIPNNSSGYFDSVIRTEKDDYYILEDIVAEFEYNSILLGTDYFKFAMALHPYNLSGIIFESEPKTQVGLISEEYVFHISDYSIPSLFEEVTPFYLLLLYFGSSEGLDDIICCYIEINIYKEDIGCFSNLNGTIIEYGQNRIFSLFFYSERNVSFVLDNYSIFYQILNEDFPMTEQFILYTDNFGRIDIYFRSSDFHIVGNFKIILNSSGTQYFKPNSFELNFVVLKNDMLLKVGANTPEKINLNIIPDSILYFPVWISTNMDNELYYDPEIHLILEHEEIEYNLIDLSNGTYLYSLAIENLESNHQIQIFSESECFNTNRLNIILNITRRSVIFNCSYQPNIIALYENPFQFKFLILDEYELSEILELPELLAVYFIYNNNWCKIPTKIMNDGFSYYFTLTIDEMRNFSKNSDVENYTIFISFIGNEIYIPCNSSFYYIYISKDDFENNALVFSLLKPLNLVGLSLITISSSILFFFSIKFYRNRIKGSYCIKKIKL
jgi:hypothetical protein